MKKYILTIVYNENSDIIEWMQEEMLDIITPSELTASNIESLEEEDIKDIFIDKDFAKA
jgi:hypothetical protein|tara:strand:- start:1033 stop:1209 length:177 start_codon:yes stop_codon:yes gene_type:complete